MNVNPQAQAIILLTVPFGKADAKPLSVKEWARFAVWLEHHGLEPSLFLKGDPKSLLSGWTDRAITLGRIETLLGRGGALGLALEKWQRAGLWVITRPEVDYPERLKRRLRFDSPPVFFGCGNRALLNRGGVAVVGSRDADEDDLLFSTSLARAAARQGLSVVSGAARGVDESAMLGAFQNEGTAIGVMADSLLRAALSAKYRKHLLSGDLVLISPFNPEAGFNVGNAMARNKHIYCLSDAAVVVNSIPNKGGTWNGAVENLKNEWVPLWVGPKDNSKSGNAALVREGAHWFPEKMPTMLSRLRETRPDDDKTGNSLELPSRSPQAESASIEDSAPQTTSSISSQEAPAKALPEDGATAKPSAGNRSSGSEIDFYNLFLQRVFELTSDGPLKTDDISECLELEKSQVNAWLKRSIADGQIKKFNKPVRYQSVSVEQRQASFFGNDG